MPIPHCVLRSKANSKQISHANRVKPKLHKPKLKTKANKTPDNTFTIDNLSNESSNHINGKSPICGYKRKRLQVVLAGP